MEVKIDCSYDRLEPLHKVVPNPKNNNKHSDEQIKRLAKIIDYQGQRSPVVVSGRSGFIVKGHARLKAIKELSWDKVAVNYQQYESEAQEYADMTADNEIARWAELDQVQLKDDLKALDFDLDMDLLGLMDVSGLDIEVLDPQCDEDEVPEVKHDPITKKGDVWLLGDHRVMCGDSTMIDDVVKLMSGEKADMVYTDPPYGINEKGDRTNRKTGLADNHNFKDFKDDSIQYAIDAYSICEGLNIPRQVWWGANYYCHSLPQTNNWFVWDKRVEDKMHDTQSDCEVAWVKSKWSSIMIFRHLWKGFNKDSERNIARVHPTQKPIALAEWCFNYYKSDFKNVLDLFLGSGSTLIACEKTNRKCFGMELDEHYCDVIVKRWQEYTGKEAVLESNKQKYNELLDGK